METILVTGGCGFIGSHTCVSLIKKNYNILIIDSLINSYKYIFSRIKEVIKQTNVDLVNRIDFLKGDLRDKNWLDNVFNDYSESNKPIKYVMHLAGLKSVPHSAINPLNYWDVNISSTLSLLSSMQKYNCTTLIFSSSASVYKANGKKLLNEEDILEPLNPYGKTKVTIEEILKDLYMSDGNWKIANLRYFNPVGSHESGLLNENPKLNCSNLFPTIMKSINGLQKKFLIFGNDWPTFDGTCIRDFIHVMDLAEAHIATLDYLNDNKPQNITINIGTGQGTSVLEVINTFQRFKNIKLSYEFVGRRIGDQSIVVADNSLALKLLNWTPQRDLFEMCNDYVKDYS